MGVYNNNKDGTRSTLANTIQVVDAPMEEFLSRGEFSAVTPNDVSADNKLVAENEVTKAVDTMPTASADLVGTIVQYVGETNISYTKGYYYECVSNGETLATYSWVQKNVQPKEDVRFNVLDYGIKRGNYPQDNRDAFVQLLANVPNGAAIYFPYGEYIFAPMNGTFNLTKDLYIIGDGLDVSIIKYKFQVTTGHHALSLNGNGINFMLKDICMKIDFDSGDNIPASEGQLINLIGTFNNILIDRVYLHTGGNLDGADMPTYNLIYSKAGCNNFEVFECIFEALLHRHYGGCIWFSPYLKLSDEVLTHVLDTLRIHDNLFRTTNGDEVIAVWEGGDATAHGVINHCFIYDNIIYHDDFNGTSFPTANIIAVYQGRDVEENIDCKIINNNIRVKRNSGSSIIKIIGYSGVDIIDNSIILDDYCETTQTFMRIFAIENKAVVTIKDNEIRSNVTTHELWITNGKGSITYIGNKLFAKNNGISFASSVVETATADMVFTVAKNDIVVNSTSNNPYISVYLGGTPIDTELREFAFVGNRIKGIKSLRTYMHGSKLIFKDNSFDVALTYSHEYAQSEALIDWENNSNIVFSSPNISPSAKVNMFTYLGYKSGLVFVGQDDSDITRSKYFNGYKITYFDKCDLTYKDIAGVYNVLDYGLKGDKTTDNTEALRTLIATIPNGSVIYFPVGTYAITEGIEINKDITFLGENEEIQTSGTASNRIHDPMSIIKYGGNTANVTMFTKASGYYDVNFVNLTLDGGNSYNVTDNWTGTFTTLPFYNQLEVVNLEGINGLNMSILSPGIVKNCMFWGFSGYGIKIAQHKYVEHCGFYKCKKGIVTTFSDSLLHDLWFCKSGTAIYMLPKENDYFASINLSDIWADQLIDHLIEADSSVTSAQIITSNIWVDSVGKSAFYLPEATVSRANIQGTFGRIGMDYAGIADADRTSALAQYTDFLACGRLRYSTLNLNISNETIGKGSNANGKCFSRLITTYKTSNNNDYNKIICNSFPVARLYDSNTQPQYSYFVDTEYNGTDGKISIYGNAAFVDGFYTYNLSPIGRIKAPSKDFLVYDRLAKKLYRSTAADDNTAWVEIDLGVIPHYSTMPSTVELLALPNNTVFETDGFYTQRDGCGGKYIISTSTLRGGLELTDGTNTRYLCVLDDYGNPANEIDVCKYGIREYTGNLYTDTITKENTYAIQNTYIITHIYLMKQLGTFKFPKGRFVFAEPLDLRERNITFEGACSPVISAGSDYIANTSDSSPATILCFPFLQNGETAITTRYNISNLIVYGNFKTYDIAFDRTKTITAPDEVVTETITDNIECTGIASTSSAVIQNVLVAGFYKGIERPNPASGYFFNISFIRCHYGINLGGDNKTIGVYGWDVHTLIRVAGAELQSVEQARVDNCVHMVELRGCKGVTLHDFDGDYCTDSMVLVDGDAEAVIATAFHARCNMLKSYDGTNADPIDVRDLADTSGYGIIRIGNSRHLKNCHFSFNRIGGQNPFDTTSNYKTPETVLTMDNWAKFEDCTFELPITADNGDYILSLFQTNTNCKSRVDTSSGTYYIEGTTVQEDNPSTNIDFSTLLGGE